MHTCACPRAAPTNGNLNYAKNAALKRAGRLGPFKKQLHHMPPEPTTTSRHAHGRCKPVMRTMRVNRKMRRAIARAKNLLLACIKLLGAVSRTA